MPPPSNSEQIHAPDAWCALALSLFLWELFLQTKPQEKKKKEEEEEEGKER